MKKEKPQTLKMICVNCGKEVLAEQGENGLWKVRCSHCGTVTVSKLMSRRHVQMDVYAPRGQILTDDGR